MYKFLHGYFCLGKKYNNMNLRLNWLTMLSLFIMVISVDFYDSDIDRMVNKLDYWVWFPTEKPVIIYWLWYIDEYWLWLVFL